MASSCSRPKLLGSSLRRISFYGLVLSSLMWRPAMAQDEVMRYANHHVEFFLPLGWKMEKEATTDSPANYLSGNEKIQLLLTYWFYDPEIPKTELNVIFDKYFDVRLATETRYMGQRDIIQAFTKKYDDTSVWKSFAGFERTTNRRFNGLVAAKNGKLLTFYIESIGEPENEHNELVMAVFASVVIK